MHGDPVRPQPKPVRAPKKRKRIKRRRSKPRRSERVRDPAYLSWLHTQECCISGQTWPHPEEENFSIWHVCEGPIEADHVGKRPKGRKADDCTAVPICQRGHAARQQYKGYFAKSREWFEKWRVEEPAKWYAKYLAHGGRRS